MYLIDFFNFIFSEIGQILHFAVSIFESVSSTIVHVFTLVSVLPLWISVPFTILIQIAMLFRVSQFIPTIGGAS